MHTEVRVLRHPANLRVRALLSCIACATSSPILACSGSSDPDPIASAGTGGGPAGSAGLGGAAGNAATSGAGGAQSAQGGAQGIQLTPFEPVVLFEFDRGVAGTYDWLPEPNAGSRVELVDEDRDATNTTPGALRFTAVFPAYDQVGQSSPVSAIYTFGDATSGTTKRLQGGTRVHFWIRLAAPIGLAASLDFFQPFIQGGAATSYSNNFGYVTPDIVSDNLWHEFVLDVAGQTYMNDVWRLGLQVAPEAAPPTTGGADAGATPGSADAGADAGTSAPAPVTFDIDYVWVE